MGASKAPPFNNIERTLESVTDLCLVSMLVTPQCVYIMSVVCVVYICISLLSVEGVLHQGVSTYMYMLVNIWM